MSTKREREPAGAEAAATAAMRAGAAKARAVCSMRCASDCFRRPLFAREPTAELSAFAPLARAGPHSRLPEPRREPLAGRSGELVPRAGLASGVSDRSCGRPSRRRNSCRPWRTPEAAATPRALMAPQCSGCGAQRAPARCSPARCGSGLLRQMLGRAAAATRQRRATVLSWTRRPRNCSFPGSSPPPAMRGRPSGWQSSGRTTSRRPQST